MSEIVYPTRNDLEWWVAFLKENDIELALPVIDENWYELVMSNIARVQHPYAGNDIHEKAAELFYNIVKGHNFLDGNKRSGIIVVYLYYVVNDKYIASKMDVRNLAKKVARSHGRTRHDWWIQELTRSFAACTTDL